MSLSDLRRVNSARACLPFGGCGRITGRSAGADPLACGRAPAGNRTRRRPAGPSLSHPLARLVAQARADGRLAANEEAPQHLAMTLRRPRPLRAGIVGKGHERPAETRKTQDTQQAGTPVMAGQTIPQDQEFPQGLPPLFRRSCKVKSRRRSASRGRQRNHRPVRRPIALFAPVPGSWTEPAGSSPAIQPKAAPPWPRRLTRLTSSSATAGSAAAVRLWVSITVAGCALVRLRCLM